jgi:hypothetical protein
MANSMRNRGGRSLPWDNGASSVGPGESLFDGATQRARLGSPRLSTRGCGRRGGRGAGQHFTERRSWSPSGGPGLGSSSSSGRFKHVVPDSPGPGSYDKSSASRQGGSSALVKVSCSFVHTQIDRAHTLEGWGTQEYD